MHRHLPGARLVGMAMPFRRVVSTTGGRMSLLALTSAAYALVIRPQLRPDPAADLVPGGKRGATMATTIDAPPSRVWPWLVQMGCNRAGWYSWDRLDNSGAPSAGRIHPEWQQIAVGDRLLSTKRGKTWFVVAALEPERFLALRASYDVRGRPFDPDGPRPRHFTDSGWCFLLEPLPGERTRLVVSGYAIGRPKVAQAIQDVLIWEPTHWVMQTRQFANLRRRAERDDKETP
jgi:hypothetical protein